MQGLVLVDKPAGPSSFAVVRQLRSRYGVKAGHAGTLDPLASGLLLVLLGSATRLARYLVGLDKRYATEIRLGLRTTTGDGEGEVVEETPLASLEEIEALEGEIELRVPQASAVKIEGERAYKLQRRGVAIEMPIRRSTIHELRVVRYEPPLVELDLKVSSGTYIRAIADQLGGHCRTIRRTAVGPFGVEDADEENVLAPLAALVSLPERGLSEEESALDPPGTFHSGKRARPGCTSLRGAPRRRGAGRRAHTETRDGAPGRMRLLRGADFRNLWLGETVSLFGDQVTLIALPLAAVLVLGRRRGRDGLPDGGGADPAPALLAPGRRLAGTRGAEALAHDRLRRGEGRLSRQHPDRLCARRAHVRAALRGRVPHGDVRGHLRHLPHDALRLGDEARGLRRGELAPERKPRLLVRRRPERGRHPRPDPERARCAAAGRVLLHRIGSLPRPDPGRGASARARRGRHVGPDEGGDALHPRAQHPAPVARVGGDAQLLQLRLRGTLHPLCDPRAARALGDARDRPRRRRDRRPARGGRGRAPHPSFRDRPHLRLRDGALPGAAPARPPRGRAQDRRSRHALQPPSFSLG